MIYNKKILFSIVIPAYNEEKMIASCIQHAQKQVCDFEYEIIVVDNNSTDNTSRIAQDFGVRVIEEQTQGVGAARQMGTKEAQGIYITHIDADTHVPQDYLSDVYKRFQKNPQLSCLGGQMYYYDAPVWKNFLRFFVHWGLWFFARVVSFGRVGPMGNNMTFKKDIYNKTTGFDRDLKYGEDMNLCRKLSVYGNIKLDMSLHVYVSVRRFRLNKQLFIYGLNFFKMCLIQKIHTNDLPQAK